MCYKQKCKVVSLNLAHPVGCGSAHLRGTTNRNQQAKQRAASLIGRWIVPNEHSDLRQ